MLASAVAANFGQFGARVVISPFVLAIAGAFAVTKADVGLVLTLLWAAFACLQFPGGVLADRYGERLVILAALGLTAVGSLLVAAAPSFLAFGAAALLLGAGSGLYFAVGTALLSRRFEGAAWPLGVHSAGGPLSGLVLPVVATAVAATRGWRVGVAIGGVVAAGAFLFVLVGVGPTPPTNPDAHLRDQFGRETLSLLARPGVAFTTLLGALGMYAFQSYTSFFPTFLQEYHHLPETRASQLFGLGFVLIAAVLPAVGSLADRYGTDAGLVVPFLVTTAGFAVLLVPGTGPTLAGVSASVLLGVVVLGVGFTWGGAFQARAMAQFDPDRRATGFGLMRTAFVLLGSVGNVATGWLAANAGWPVAYGTLAGLLVVGAALVVGNHLLGA